MAKLTVEQALEVARILADTPSNNLNLVVRALKLGGIDLGEVDVPEWLPGADRRKISGPAIIPSPPTPPWDPVWYGQQWTCRNGMTT